MKKSLMLLVSMYSISSIAGSLEDKWSKQIVEVISPVKISGESVLTGSETGICQSLGFTRVVGVKSSPCPSNMVYFVTGMGAAATTEIVSCRNSAERSVLDSVTCAK